jgi:hypothetical protein
MNELKQCSKCKEFLAIDLFSKSKKEKSGLKSSCKLCNKIYNKLYLKKKMEDPEYRRCKQNSCKKWRKKKLEEDPEYYKNEYYRRHDSSKQRAKKYYKNNKNKCLDASKKWRQNNKQAFLKASQTWKKNNQDQYRQKHREWIKNNAELVRKYNQKRRALKFDATIQDFTLRELNDRMSVFYFRCAYCGGPFEQIDHVIPLSKGGKHCLSNLRPACRFCNLSKHNKNLSDWLKIKGY